MLSCKKATELVEKKSLVGLSLRENMRLHIHSSMCDGCTAYQKQSLLIDKILYDHLQGDESDVIPEIENNGLKERLISNLRKG